MNKDNSKYLYFSNMNIEANFMLSKLFSVSMLAGALIYFIAQVFVSGDRSLGTISFCISIALMGFIPRAFVAIKASPGFTSTIIGILNAFSYFYIATRSVESAGLTAWAAAFVLIAASMLYIDKTALVLTGVGIISTLVFIAIVNQRVLVEVTLPNHLGRIGIVVVVLGLTFYANHIFKRRLDDNFNQIAEITGQKQEITSLYEQIAASEEQLQMQLHEIIGAQEKINHLAYFDDLTGLTNRPYFMDRVSKAIEEYAYRGERFAVMFADLDNFKKVNDLMGHQTGDAIIRKLSERIRNILKEADTISRIGGDEFAILLRSVGDGSALEEKAKEILQVLGQPCTHNKVTHYLSSSIGIAVYPDNGHNREELIMNVDTAMYKAKALGKNTYVLFNDSIKAENEEKLKMEINLRNALINNELDINYQMVVDSETGGIRGFEALMRWNPIIPGMVSPSRFVPILEETGLIISFGEWILMNACRQNKEWQDRYRLSTIISVNISAVQFKEKNFVERIKAVLSESGLEPRYLELEITESILIDEFYNVVEKLKELKSLGVRVSLDDFGTGFSSLNYLIHLPINTLKIDRSFVADIKPESSNRSIIGSIISLAHDMRFEVVAEGVETEEQKAYLTEKHCDFLQGFYFSRPVEAALVERKL